MKITKRGTIWKPWYGPWRCASCGSEWILDASDSEPRTDSDNRDMWYSMICPVCKDLVNRGAIYAANRS